MMLWVPLILFVMTMRTRDFGNIYDCSFHSNLIMIEPLCVCSEYRAAMTEMAHYKADVVIFTNDDPGVQYPNDIIADMMGSLPDEIISRHTGSVYSWLQDPKRVPQWFEKWLYQYQSEVERYIIEDRFSGTTLGFYIHPVIKLLMPFLNFI